MIGVKTRMFRKLEIAISVQNRILIAIDSYMFLAERHLEGHVGSPAPSLPVVLLPMRLLISQARFAPVGLSHPNYLGIILSLNRTNLLPTQLRIRSRD